jgi:hypothetical protein
VSVSDPASSPLGSWGRWWVLIACSRVTVRGSSVGYAVASTQDRSCNSIAGE